MPPPSATTSRQYRLPQISCPSCNALGLDVAEVEYKVEDFGPVLMSVSNCKSCGFKHTDVFSLTSHEPTATILKVTSTDDLKIRVVRGNTGTILVPELGVSIAPGQNNEGFISNVEGVLSKIEDVLRFLARSLRGRKKQKSELLLRKIRRAKDGKLRFTLVLKDPFGNSSILSEKARRRKIGLKELSRLKFGDQAIATRKRS